jgi:tRNA(Arg) A34 adenosine deaminase TadA
MGFLRVCLLASFVLLCACQTTYPGTGAFTGFNTVRPRTTNYITNIDARNYNTNDMIPALGVSKECLVIMDNIAWQVQMNSFASLCPRGQFGALVVNFNDDTGSVRDSSGRSCGRILATNRGQKTTTDVTEHAENDALRRFAYHHPGNRANSSLWAPLAMFTPGASCPMDTSSEIWAGISWQIYSLSIADLIALNFSQIALEPEALMTTTGTVTTQQLGLVRYVNRAANVARFGYKNMPSNPCPTGCYRPTATSLCTDINPFVLTPSMIIPDVNYYVVPDDFQLVNN